MNDYSPLIGTLVFGFSLAFTFGYIAHRIKISPIVGYLIAGIFIGPFTPGFIADPNLTNELAEIGVILLMFGIGLHFSIADLNSVKKVVIPGAILQIFLTTLVGVLFGLYLKWHMANCLLFGLSISVASTVVLLRSLEDLNLLKTREAHIAIGWLIMEDLAMILVLIILPALATILNMQESQQVYLSFFEQHPLYLLIFTLFKMTTFIFAMCIFGRKLIPSFLHHVAKNSSNELFRLAILCIALSIAFVAAKLFDVSLALGAFFAGMILSESVFSQRAAEEILPLRDAFSVLFFVSVGMLFNPITLVEQPGLILMTTLFIMLAKSLFAFMIMIFFRYPLSTACLIAVSLAQIGEFSFILSTLGYKVNLMTHNVKDLIIAGAMISMIINPILFRLTVNFFQKDIIHKKRV